jgi:hypothetical protein
MEVAFCVGLLERFNLTAEYMFQEALSNQVVHLGRQSEVLCTRMDFCNMSRARMGDSVHNTLWRPTASVLECLDKGISTSLFSPLSEFGVNHIVKHG